MVKRSFSVLAMIPLTFGSFLGLGDHSQFVSPTVGPYLLSEHEISLDNRYPVKSVSEVFKNNILLNLAYLRGAVSKASDINWDEVTKPFIYEFRLKPGESFAFHEDIKDKYKQTLVKTANAHFNAADGFKTDGYLFGDGVCHLASLFYWTALDAGLTAEAPTNHDFATIPDIDKKYGVSIYYNPNSRSSNSLQNLYIQNNREQTISFKFEYKQSLRPDGLKDNKVKVSVIQLN